MWIEAFTAFCQLCFCLFDQAMPGRLEAGGATSEGNGAWVSSLPQAFCPVSVFLVLACKTGNSQLGNQHCFSQSLWWQSLQTIETTFSTSGGPGHYTLFLFPTPAITCYLPCVLLKQSTTINPMNNSPGCLRHFALSMSFWSLPILIWATIYPPSRHLKDQLNIRCFLMQHQCISGQ